MSEPRTNHVELRKLKFVSPRRGDGKYGNQESGFKLTFLINSGKMRLLQPGYRPRNMMSSSFTGVGSIRNVEDQSLCSSFFAVGRLDSCLDYFKLQVWWVAVLVSNVGR